MPPPTLEIRRTGPNYRVHYRALEVYLARVYRLTNFNVLKAARVTHGMYPEYLIQGVVPPALRGIAGRIRVGTHYRDIGLVLTILCADGRIPAGNYVLDTQRLPEPLEAYKALLQRTLNPFSPECVHFREKHRSNRHFRKMARVIDRSLVEWLKQESPGEL